MTVALDLAPLEQAVVHALAADDQSAIHVMGYGEITCVLAWPERDGPWACKRLPVFDGPERLERYRERLTGYLRALDERGVHVHDSRLATVAGPHGITAYIVQPTIPAPMLGPAILRGASEPEGRALLADIFDRVVAVCSPTVGLDAQLSNWARVDGRLVYFDVSTPMLRDEEGHDLLDTELFIASLPAFMRPVVRKLLLGSILDQYFSPRATALDVVANLHKEALTEWVPPAIELVNEQLVGEEPLTDDEARAYYRRDARIWGMLQFMRRLDRRWQRRVRRRPYPFLLPDRIDRHV